MRLWISEKNDIIPIVIGIDGLKRVDDTRFDGHCLQCNNSILKLRFLRAFPSTIVEWENEIGFVQEVYAKVYEWPEGRPRTLLDIDLRR